MMFMRSFSQLTALVENMLVNRYRAIEYGTFRVCIDFEQRGRPECALWDTQLDGISYTGPLDFSDTNTLHDAEGLWRLWLFNACYRGPLRYSSLKLLQKFS